MDGEGGYSMFDVRNDVAGNLESAGIYRRLRLGYSGRRLDDDDRRWDIDGMNEYASGYKDPQLDEDDRRRDRDEQPQFDNIEPNRWNQFVERMMGMGYKQHDIDNARRGCAHAKCRKRRGLKNCGVLKCVEYELGKQKVETIVKKPPYYRYELLESFVARLKDIERDSTPSAAQICSNPGRDIMHVRCWNRKSEPKPGRNCPYPTGCTIKYHPSISPLTTLKVWDFNGKKSPSWLDVTRQLKEWQIPYALEKQLKKDWHLPSGSGINSVDTGNMPKEFQTFIDGKSRVYYWDVNYEIKLVGVIKRRDGTAEIGYFYGQGTAKIQPYLKCWRRSRLMMTCGQDKPTNDLIEGSRRAVEHYIVKYALNQGYRSR